MKTLAFALLAAALAPAAAFADGEHAHSGATAFGEPGDPRQPSRTVEVVMKETDDGGMSFEPDSMSARTGEQVRFVLRNEGQVDHEFMLATRAENDRHAVAMRQNPDMEHDEPNGRRVAAGKSDEITWKFSKSGEFNFACLIPGHREAGMDGVIAVKRPPSRRLP